MTGKTVEPERFLVSLASDPLRWCAGMRRNEYLRVQPGHLDMRRMGDADRE